MQIFKDIWTKYPKYIFLGCKYLKMFGNYSEYFFSFWMQLFKDIWRRKNCDIFVFALVIANILLKIIFIYIYIICIYSKRSPRQQLCPCLNFEGQWFLNFSRFILKAAWHENFPGVPRWKIWYFRQNKLIAQGTALDIRWMNIFMSPLHKIAGPYIHFGLCDCVQIYFQYTFFLL